MRRRLSVRGGGELDNFFSSKGYMAPDDKWFSQQMQNEDEEERESPLALIQNGAPVAFGLLALVSAIAWIRTRLSRPRSDGGHEKEYADSVAALEAQLHRLSVDRQMLADEFAEARKGLESQIASVTTAAELSREEMESALDRAEREATSSKMEYSSLSARFDAEVRTSQQLREEKARQQVEIDALRRRLAEASVAAAAVAATPAPTKKAKRKPPTASARRADEDNAKAAEEEDNEPSSSSSRRRHKATTPKKKTPPPPPSPPSRKKKTKPDSADELVSSDNTTSYFRAPPASQVAELRRQLELTRNKIAKNGGDVDGYDD